jgi:hypothetical protein
MEHTEIIPKLLARIATLESDLAESNAEIERLQREISAR